MSNYNKYINSLLQKILSTRIIGSADLVENFYDEPRFFLYITKSNNTKKYSDGEAHSKIESAGFSFTSKPLALLKCLGETVEHFALYCYRRKSILYSKFADIKQNALDPALFENGKSLRDKYIGWVQGFNLTRNSACLIPAQLTFINYMKRNNEGRISQPNISTGAAGGINHESTLLHGIYEVVERDCFMTIYLTRIKTPRINLDIIENNILQSILASCKRYRLELFVFNITNDLEIPAFLSILVDRTGIGPVMSCGLRSGLKVEDALIACIQESFLPRAALRKVLIKNKFHIPNLQPIKIDTLLERALFWSHPSMLRHLDFLINQKPINFNLENFSGNKKTELSKVTNLLRDKEIEIFYADITPPFLKGLDYPIYRIIIPQLQPLHLYEHQKVLRKKRIKDVARFFGQKNYKINIIPHPII